MNPVYIASDNIISPLGFSTGENFAELEQMHSGLKKLENTALSAEPVCAAIISDQKIDQEFARLDPSQPYTRLEKMMILSVSGALGKNDKINPGDPKTVFIISTTKGNIDLLDKDNKGKFGRDRLMIWETANVINAYFKNPNKPLVVSNACISGVLALIIGKRLLETGQYENAVICGGDLLSHFVVSGFQSFKAVSQEVCKPYDAARDGISMGEAAGTIILTNNDGQLSPDAEVLTIDGGASSNDANHISGPSRDGEGLRIAIQKTLQESGLKPEQIDHICGHGTATIFNDDMESLAISDAGLAEVPMNSLKSYFGHTLGAAGIIESVIALESMRHNTMIGTYNHSIAGTAKPVNILSKTTRAGLRHCLKTAAGFGGCNAAIIFSKQ